MLNSRIKKFAIALFDIICIILSMGLALAFRFDFSIDLIKNQYIDAWVLFTAIHTVVLLIIFCITGMYHFVWRSVSANDVAKMLMVTTLTYVISLSISIIIGNKLPRSVWLMGYIISIILHVGARCFLRFWADFKRYHELSKSKNVARIMLIGAGEAGRMLSREILSSRQISAKVCCVIDDNKSKWGKFLDNAPIVGGREKITECVTKYDINQIIFAIPTASAQDKREILNICKDTGCHTKILPGVYQVLNGEVTLSAVQDVSMEDILGRESIKLDQKSINEFIGGKTILVTGVGSIGSELCRQIAMHNPGKLILIDIYENNAYDIQQELRRKYGKKLDMEVYIASIRDKARIYRIFKQNNIDIVFHAAAHKHVPLMEDSPGEAIKNNVFGTYHVVRAAEKYGVSKFVMISTDKAVNPTNIMGATKRFCEMILQSRYASKTEYCSVRFGNVLGSNGSVVPLFKKQISEGGPITITDKRIIRYFMTIPEAAQLVLEAGAMAKQSQIFVLDMGEPVKILTLAENLIKLSGLTPYEDIDIVEIGLRPGEKLYEELLMKSENLIKTDNEKIFVEEQQHIEPEVIMNYLQILDNAVESKTISKRELIDLMQSCVPTYQDPEKVNADAIKSEEMKLALAH